MSPFYRDLIKKTNLVIEKAFFIRRLESNINDDSEFCYVTLNLFCHNFSGFISIMSLYCTSKNKKNHISEIAVK